MTLAKDILMASKWVTYVVVGVGDMVLAMVANGRRTSEKTTRMCSRVATIRIRCMT